MEKLKLCPFCGGSPEMNCFPGADTSMTYLRVKCASCGATGGALSAAGAYERAAEVGAAALWNLREGVAGATVRRGKWLNRNDPVYNAVCSVCDYASPLKSNFCPHCGAEMDLGAEG